MAVDFKKTHKELYQPGAKPVVIEVPEMVFIMVDGSGDPNTSAAYQAALEALYGLAYTIKMSKKGENTPKDYYDFVVPPLEGLWWTKEGEFDPQSHDKADFCWRSMLRMPEFVTLEVFEAAKLLLAKKKPSLDLSFVRYEVYREGLCAQVMHMGSYDSEPATISTLKAFVIEAGFTLDISENRKHHEIYLNDPRKTAPEKLKTIIRYPIV